MNCLISNFKFLKPNIYLKFTSKYQNESNFTIFTNLFFTYKKCKEQAKKKLENILWT